MKLAVFRSLIKDMNCNLGETETEIYVKKRTSNRLIASVTKNKRFIFSTYPAIKDLNQSEQEELFHILTEIASTPTEEREEEKRYRLRFIGEIDDGCCYLNISKKGNRTFKTKHESKSFKTIFTESELEDMDEEGFIREEVTE